MFDFHWINNCGLMLFSGRLCVFFGLNEGSVFSAPHNGRFEKVLSSDSADMVDGFQKLALESRLAIPIIYGVDAIHGNSSVYGATRFPHNVGLLAKSGE